MRLRLGLGLRRLPVRAGARRRRSIFALTCVAAVAAAGTSSAAVGHRVAESATYQPYQKYQTHQMHQAYQQRQGGAAPTPFTIVSPNFHDGGRLPSWTEFGGPYADEAGCAGKNLSPALGWFNAPSGTESYALFVHDVDAPQAFGWTHWVTYNIPGNVSYLRKGDDAAYTQGTTDWQANGIPQVGWGGPCPPADGETHHYVFTLYALSTSDITTSGLDYTGLMNVIAPYVLGATSIMGTYSLS
ncbi:MAG TPA: YbhB/YbcL family Raf kinase inhibitor-like protein [Actinospica sp.]|nr:YbhB/YbcL family Raf kinase inhibitor-like protein [Actinospica sp.]